MSDTPAVASPNNSQTPLETVTMTLRDQRLWAITGLIVVVACIAELIGQVEIPLGAKVTMTLLPMIWAILMGGFISGNPWKPLPVP